MMTRTIAVADVEARLIEEGDDICNMVRAGKPYEPQTLARWAALCSMGGTVLDIGAYTGLFSIIAARQGCDVIAFEPMPPNAQRCAVNFALNGVAVDLRQSCVSDRDGEAVMRFNPKVKHLTAGAGLLGPSGGTGAADEDLPMTVRSATIDGLNLERPTAIKIDVERGEPLVLAGARQTLDRLRPVLIVEVLGEREGEAIGAVLPPFYRRVDILDGRNWLMVGDDRLR